MNEELNINDYLTEECLQNTKISEEFCDDEILHQKKVAIKIIKDLKQKWPHVLLAGGAPRDWQHNKTAKDLDFFILQTSFKDFYVNDLEEILLQKISTSRINNNPYENLNGMIKAVYNAEIYDIKCQFIIISCKEKVSSPRQFVDLLTNSFDIGLCMIFFDENYVYKTKYFLHDYKNKELSIYIKNFQNFTQFLHHIKHMNRISHKYPEYSLKFVTNDKQTAYLNQMFYNYTQLYEEKYAEQLNLGEKDEFEAYTDL